jgi:hypothetical protein
LTDTENHCLRKISPSGLVTTIAGRAGQPGYADGRGTLVAFNEPEGIVVNASGSIFITDTLNHVVRVVSPAGDVTTFSGTPLQPGFVDGIRHCHVFSFFLAFFLFVYFSCSCIRL